MTKYIKAFSWTRDIQAFLEEVVTEKPLLNVCSGRSRWGDKTVDLSEPADLNQDWTALDFPADSYGAVFADPPWNAAYKKACGLFMERALRIAPVVYLMAPWTFGSSVVKEPTFWVRWFPGIQTPIFLARYERKAILTPTSTPRAARDRTTAN